MRNFDAVQTARRSGLADRASTILSTNVSRAETNRRAALISMIVVFVVLLPLSAMHLIKRSARWSAALAAEVMPQAATMPSDAKNLPPLPDRFSSKRVAIQVLTPVGKPLPIDSIQYIYVWIPEGKWMDGPTPQILARYADGWVFVDKEMFALARPGQRVDFLFSTGGTALAVSGKYPADSPKKITLMALFDPKEVAVDTSAGPATGKDEVAGQVVDPNGSGVAGAVVSFPDLHGARTHKAFTTGSEGVFRFSGFIGQRFTELQVEKTGYATRILINVPVGHGFLVHMDAGTRMKGQFLGSDGLPASNAKIEFVTSKAVGRPNMIDQISDLTVSAQADNQGRYDVPLEPGEYEIHVAAPTGVGRYEHVEVPSGQIIGLSEKLGPAANLRIVAIDTLTNEPASGVRMWIEDRSGFFVGIKKDSMRTTDSKGVAEWDKLMPGALEVDVSSDVYGQWWTDEMKKQGFGRFIDSLEFDVSEGMAPVTVHMEPGVHVSGTVVSPDGKPVAGAEVNIGGLRTGDSRYARRTDAAGSFALTFPILNMNMGNDNVALKCAIVASDLQHRWANVTGDWFTPSVGEKLTVNLKMTAGARLRGRFIGSDGKPVGNVLVRARADDDLDTAYYDPEALSDAQGRFELGPMRAAKYSVYFAGDENSIWPIGNLPSLSMTVADGDRLETGDIKYTGPSPAAPSQWVQNNFGGRAPVPVTDDASWHQVTPVLVPATVQTPPAPTPQQERQPQESQVFPLEEPLPGTPAPAGHLSGKVVDESGKPIPGVVIIIWARDHGDRTDSQGHFSFTSLPPKRGFEIRFLKDNYCPRFIPAQPSGLAGLVVVLTNKTYFEGQVNDPAGKPVAGAKVRGDEGEKQSDGSVIPWVWTETTSDANGNYRLYVQPDTYDIQVRVPSVGVVRTGKLPIADGQTKHLDLNLTPGITFRARVVDSISNNPVAGVRLWSNQDPGIEGNSDPSGNLVIPFMVPGVISLNVDAKGYARWWSDLADKEWERQLDTRNGQLPWNWNELEYDMKDAMPVASIVVEPEVKISGIVVDPDDKPVSGASVCIADTGTNRAIAGNERFSVVTTTGGAFQMTLPASETHGYNLFAHDRTHGKWRKYANGVLPILYTTPGQVLTNIKVTLTRPAAVRGHVVDEDGNPVVGREVRAVPSDLLEDMNNEPTARTDQNGDFELKYVRPTSQMIQVAPFVFRMNQIPQGTSVKVDLTEGQTLDGVNLTAMPGNDE
jgi:hypothetical protein